MINRDNIDHYYKIINDKIDNYFVHGITASEIVRYLKENSKGYKRFMKANDLGDIENINKVIRDVIQDRLASEEVQTFENFTPDDNNEDIKISTRYPVTPNDLKIVADYYNVSLGHIESDANFLKITGLHKEKMCIVMSYDNISDVLKKVANQMYIQLVNDRLFLGETSGISIKLTNAIDKQTFIDEAYFRLNINSGDIIKEIIIQEHDIHMSKAFVGDGVMIFEA